MTSRFLRYLSFRRNSNFKNNIQCKASESFIHIFNSFQWNELANMMAVFQILINAFINTIPTKVNFCRLGKRISATCSLGKNWETLHHSLNHCEPKLERSTLRHINVLNWTVFCLLCKKENLDDSISLRRYSKFRLPGERTIPPEIVVNWPIPAFVMINYKAVNIVPYPLISTPWMHIADKQKNTQLYKETFPKLDTW